MSEWSPAELQTTLWLPPEDVEFGAVLSRSGSSGIVHRGKWKGREVAIKSISLPSGETPGLDLLSRETAVILHASRDCRHISKFHGVTIKDSCFCLVMKLYPSNLSRLIHQHPGNRMPPTVAVKHGIDIAKALVELHTAGVIVCDLKPDNVLIDDLGDAIITDFGLSRVVSQSIGAFMPSSPQGTPNYMAPEQFDTESGQGVTQKADTWAFACTLLHMLDGKPPWSGCNMMQICYQVVVRGAMPQLPQGMPSELVTLLGSCFQRASDQRPTSKEVLQALQACQHAMYTHMAAAAAPADPPAAPPQRARLSPEPYSSNNQQSNTSSMQTYNSAIYPTPVGSTAPHTDEWHPPPRLVIRPPPPPQQPEQLLSPMLVSPASGYEVESGRTPRRFSDDLADAISGCSHAQQHVPPPRSSHPQPGEQYSSPQKQAAEQYASPLRGKPEHYGSPRIRSNYASPRKQQSYEHGGQQQPQCSDAGYSRQQYGVQRSSYEASGGYSQHMDSEPLYGSVACEVHFSQLHGWHHHADLHAHARQGSSEYQAGPLHNAQHHGGGGHQRGEQAMAMSRQHSGFGRSGGDAEEEEDDRGGEWLDRPADVNANDQATNACYGHTNEDADFDPWHPPAARPAQQQSQSAAPPPETSPANLARMIRALYSNDASVVGDSLVAVARAASAAREHPKLLQAGIVAALVRVLNWKPAQPELLCGAAEAVRLLGRNDDNDIVLSRSGVVAALVALLHSSEADVLVKVMAALRSLFCVDSTDTKALAAHAGALPALVQLLGHSSAAVVLQAAAALKNLATERDIKLAICMAGALPPLVQLLSQSDPLVVEQVAFTIMNLAGHPGNCSLISRVGAVPALTALLQHASQDIATAAAAALRSLGHYRT